MSEIMDVIGREIIDSRGNPTIEVDVFLSTGDIGRASAPSGASTGEREAVEIRDGNKKRYAAKGVLKAVENVSRLVAPQMIGMDVLDQSGIDRLLLEIDGTANKSKLGGNVTTAVSVAAAKAGAVFMGMPLYRYVGGTFARELPVPMLNIINGGKHSDNNVDIQEFMIMPVGAPNFREAIRYSAETFHALKDILNKLNYSTGVGDEGGFAPNLKSNSEALDIIVQAIEKAGYKPGNDIAIAIDAASSSFYKDGKYILEAEARPKKSSDQMIKFYEELISQYPVVSLEDGLDENDWEGWKNLTSSLGSKVQLVGDDLFCTNSIYLSEGIRQGCANSILIKVNQVGTLTETMDTIVTARRAGYTTIISHRSGETEDPWIADLSVAFSTGQIKSGSVSRSERLSKYNQLIRIEEELGDNAIFRGKKVLYSVKTRGV
jgi:enolase